MYIEQDDPELAGLISLEEERLAKTLDLIAAENHAPRSVLEVMGSCLNTKTIEGYPGNRFHAGCVHVDAMERLAMERGRKLFGAGYINVQPHSGTSANLAVYFSVLEQGDRVLAMSLPHGGHLSHGHRASMTSTCFSFHHYGLNPDTEQIDYDDIREKARTIGPRMIVAGASSYPRLIDYERIAGIAREVSALFLVDMAHLAGLVAAGVVPSPVPHADFVTFTSYKTMMGGRGGVILSREEFARKIDSAVFPGCQGTSAVNMLAAKALIFKLAMEERFITIQEQTLANARLLADEFTALGYRIVSGGTDNHLVMLDLSGQGISGKTAENRLEAVGIVLNRNVIPSDADQPGRVSGIRLGSGAVSARGMAAPEMKEIAALVDRTLRHWDDPQSREEISSRVGHLCRAFPLNL